MVMTFRTVPLGDRSHRMAAIAARHPMGAVVTACPATRRCQTVVAVVTAGSLPLAASRTAPATAPATFSLKTLGMM